MKYSVIIGAIALVVVQAMTFSGPVKADTLIPAVPAGQAPTASYVLAPADVVTITVSNFDNLNSEVVVPPDGNASLPLLGSVNFIGKTTDQLTQMLTKQWSKYVINPIVTVTLKQKHIQNVYFYGYVTRPGAADYIPSLHILEGLAEVGGTLSDADLSNVTVTHKSGVKETLDLSLPATRGGTASDIVLQEEDTVYVPESHKQFSVFGEVKTPGSYQYKDEMTLSDALTTSGGLLDTADLNAATLTHNGKVMNVNLYGLVKQNDLRQNIKLSPGDSLLVPLVHNRVYVFGDVLKPGYYDFKPQDRVLDALSYAQPMQNAKFAKVNLIYTDPGTRMAKMDVLDMNKLLLKGHPENNRMLEPGDVVYIPKQSDRFTFQDLVGVFAAVSTVNTLGAVSQNGLGTSLSHN